MTKSKKRKRAREAAGFGAEISRRREAAEMTTKGLAIRANVSESCAHNIQKGRISPTLDIMQRLAEGLGVRLAELLPSREGMSPKAVEFAMLFDDAIPEARDLSLVVLRSVRR